MRSWWLAILTFGCTLPDKSVPVGDDVVSTPTPATDSDTDDTVTEVETVDSAPVRETGVNVDTDVVLPDTGEPVLTRIRVLFTADDRWSLWIDGIPYTAPNQASWQYGDELELELPGRRHVIAVAANDIQNVIAGFIGVVWVSIEKYSVTGDGRWKSTDVAPAADWTELLFDDSAWSTALTCAPQDAAVWGTYWPAPFLAEGAQWQWSKPCRQLGSAWFRLVIE